VDACDDGALDAFLAAFALTFENDRKHCHHFKAASLPDFIDELICKHLA
jgi:hypothetical protein